MGRSWSYFRVLKYEDPSLLLYLPPYPPKNASFWLLFQIYMYEYFEPFLSLFHGKITKKLILLYIFWTKKP